MAGWIQQYSVVYPEYEGLRANCQQFSAWAYEALTDAFWWDKRQAATSSTLRLFVGPGDRKGTKGKLATLSAASAKESVKPSVTTAVTSSLAVGKVAEKIGIKAITTFATELAINAEKTGLLDKKCVLSKSGQIVFPKPAATPAKTSPKNPDAKYLVGDCTRISEFSCWYNEEPNSYECNQNAAGDYKCYCTY